MTTEPDIDEIELSTDLAEAFRQLGNREDPPRTLGEGFAIVEEALDEADVDVSLDDMYQTEPTRHAVHIGETLEHVPCVLDALIMALTLDTDPVEIHSESPNGEETVQFRVTDEAVTVTPESAVTSFGIGYEEADEADVANTKELLNDESTIPTTCSHINAFPDSETYIRWADDVSKAAVMKLGIEEMVAIARRTAQSD